MNFSDPQKVQDVVRRMQDSSWAGDSNMAKINSLFNGDPAWTKAEAKKHKVQINLPSQRAPALMDQARAQWETAFTSRDKYFRCRCKEGEPEKRVSWSLKFTKNLATIMKRSKEFLNVTNETGAQVMLHGRGPLMWENVDKWCPYAVGLGDLKINSRALSSFTNLGYWAAYKRFTPFELFDAALGDYPDPQWNKPMVKRILHKLADVNTEVTDFTRYEFPAEIVEDFKSNSGYWASDAVPTVLAWDFYYRMDGQKGWGRKMVLDRDNPSLGIDEDTGNDWLYEGKDVYQPKLENIMQCIFANGCHVAPFRWASTRGLGYRLYDEARYEARAESRFKETVLQDMLWVFYNVPAEEREKLESFWLSHMGVLPPGVKWVPANERYRPDVNLIMAGLNQSRQLMAEQSTSYVQDLESGGESSDRETATKTMARMQQANSMIGNFLVKSYEQWRYVGVEVVRRFLRKNSLDPEVKEFQEMCLKDGIPEELMEEKCWDTEPERVAGNGNRILAAAMADRLMMQYNRLDPSGQKIAMRLYVDANTDDPELGDAIAPMAQEDESPTVGQAYKDVGPLMRGLPAPITRTENQIEYTETLLKAMGQLVQQAAQVSNGMPTMETVIGLATMGQEIQKRMQLIGQDPGERQRVKIYGDVVGKLMNQVKAFAQRLQEQAQKRGQQLDPEVMAKLQGMQMLTQAKVQAKQISDQQKMRHKEISFWADQRRKDAESRISAVRELHGAQLDAAVTDIRTEADIRNGARMKAFEGEGE